MDSAEDEAAPSSEIHLRKLLLEIANNRPGTNVAKSIQSYDEQPDLATLVLLLEEVSKNTDYSTDLRLSLVYYLNEFLRHCSPQNKKVSRRSAIVNAGSVLQYCGKIYGDRVEYMYQVVEHQIESLLSSEKETQNENGKEGDKAVSPPEAAPQRKRRTKKLTQKEVDPYMLNVEPRKFKKMSEEKRFSTAGFVKCSRNRTIEYLYQDHTPPNLWRHAPIVDPQNPFEIDEKKHYKLFSYHVEHRYNTLLPDIPFERLNLIKEYVDSNQVNTSEMLNEHMTTKDYLDEYIALENQMLASRYGAKARTRTTNRLEKRLLEQYEDEGASQDKRPRLDIDETAAAAAAAADDGGIDEAEPMELDECGEELSKQISVDSGISIDASQLENSIFNASQTDAPPFSSTLANNESSILDGSQIDLPSRDLSTSDADVSEEKQVSHSEGQLDSGIGMEEISDLHSFSRICATDLEDQRIGSLSPKVMVRDILPGVPNKDTMSVHLDAEMLALSGVDDSEVPPKVIEEGNTAAVEPEPQPACKENPKLCLDVCYEIKLNILNIPQKRLRGTCLFKLPKTFDLFKQSRLPSRREGETKSGKVKKISLQANTGESPTPEDEVVSKTPLSLEFDQDQNFLGFRRLTYDSGFDFEEIRAESAVEEKPPALLMETLETEANKTIDESIAIVDETCEADISVQLPPACEELPNGQLNETTASASEDIPPLPSEVEEEEEEALPETIADNNNDEDANIDANDAHNHNDEPMPSARLADDISKNPDMIDLNDPIEVDNSEAIQEWHRRLAPALEAAHARQNFDIQALGTEILNVCQAENGEASMAKVMEDKDPTTLCRYMLASLLLTNHGNVSLDFGQRNKSKPMELDKFNMKLLSTHRQKLHPEDDVGNVQLVKAKTIDKRNCSKLPPASVRAKRKSTELPVPVICAKTVRLIQPIPKSSQSPEDTDSGISSLPSSQMSTSTFRSSQL
ncbi:uncharacterized protein LOC6651440 isoform X2 [Drosophila willistoni]|uniref:uncharacterized protein LOC6651440 isoform X2 n=1 Tax=Drosophila willistoni TaxID=7260 RepID=UPI00017D9233|nr:uncharacterized protein LOC6651440 isoform X2 [Drosophila willistoni]